MIVRGAVTLPPSVYLRLVSVIRNSIRASTPAARVFIETPASQQPAFLADLGSTMRSWTRAAAFDGLVLRLSKRAMSPDLRLPPPPAPTLNAMTFGRLRLQLSHAFRQTHQSPLIPIIIAGAGNEAITALRAAACEPNVTAISLLRAPSSSNSELARVAKLTRTGSLRPCDMPAAPAVIKPSAVHGETGLVFSCQRDCRFTIALTENGAAVAGHSGSLEGGEEIRVGWPGLPARAYKALIVTAPRFGPASSTMRQLRIRPASAPHAP